MAKLEDLTPKTIIKGIIPNQNVTVINAEWHGNDVVELTYKDIQGQPHTQLLFRDSEADLEIVTAGQPWSFDGDGALFRLVSEAHRINLGHLFDPLLAVHTSLVEPLPHQIIAVYGEMLNRQPLRFLLADDPGAGKTIMAGLFIRELLIRGDLQRCLIVCPGSLAVQWQDELDQKFHLPFEILTKEKIETSRTGNPLAEIPLAIARLDQLSRSQDLQIKLKQTDWDLVVVDEAHKMSASFFGGDIRETKRYKLGKLLSTLTRHFLLMTATPHNGKEEDFQLFLALLDGDRFEGKFRDGVHACDTSDLMRRLVKEDLLKFDAKPLFPERLAHTVQYNLSDLEAHLYKQVTDYVREEFNRADNLAKKRRGTVGFALTILQRRLASSPEAIYQSISRRKERLQTRLREEELLKRGEEIDVPEDWEEYLEDLSSAEQEAAEEELVDQATAARTIAELQAEIDRLKELENLALRVRRSGRDRKWEELSRVISMIFSPQRHEEHKEEHPLWSLCLCGYAKKLVIFTEHRDTLNYLYHRITTLLGRPEAVVTIHGGMGREERKKAEEAFKQDVRVEVLIATDAAGEGINLQRAHLMVNYDLPWNPNRLEQRFGRIHRIGQTEVCHLWNLVAGETREGDVYLSLLKKLEIEQKALGGKVFDVLGKAIAGQELRELLIEAIRYGDRPDVKAKLNQVLSDRLDQNRLQDLLEERALARDSMDASKVQRIRQNMERAEARKLQPYFIATFFLEAFQHLGGTIRQREPKRYEITHVPATIRNRDRLIGRKNPILRSYERICFDKSLISIPGKPLAEFICPGHPLLDATLDLILERHRQLLRQGTILIDENNPESETFALIYLEHSIKDGRGQIISKRMQYVEIPLAGENEPQRHKEHEGRNAGYAPYLDYRPITPQEIPLCPLCLCGENTSQTIETKAKNYAIQYLVNQHRQEVYQHKKELLDKITYAVKDRLTKEINYWDWRAAELKQQEQAGKVNAKINSAKAQQRADELAARLEKRLIELEQEKQIIASPPVVVGGALVISQGRLNQLLERENISNSLDKKQIEIAAINAVINAEQKLDHQPQDISGENRGYDIESLNPQTSRLTFIEVKGRIAGATNVTITKNEIITALNQPEQYILALVKISPETDPEIRYISQPFQKEPDFGVNSVNYNWADLWNRGKNPL